MNIFVNIVGFYFIIGIISLLILEITTHRITRKIDSATYDAQSKLAGTGTVLNYKTARLFLVFAIFVFWPAIFIGMIPKINKPVVESSIANKYNAFLDFDLTRLLPEFIRRRIKKNG